MKNTTINRSTAVFTVLFALVTGSPQASEEDLAAQSMAAIEKAEAAQKKADSVNGEWRDTGKLIKQAKAAAKNGDYHQALSLANTAFRQGELGYQQALSQKGADFPDYLR